MRFARPAIAILMLAGLAVACSTPAPDDQIRPVTSAASRAKGDDADDDDDDSAEATNTKTTPTKTTPNKAPTSTDATPTTDDPPVEDDPPADDDDGPLDTPTNLVDKGCCVSGRFVFCHVVSGTTCGQVVVSEESCVNAPENDSQCV